MMALLATFGLLAAAGTPHAACSASKAQALYEYRSVSPLLIAQDDAGMAVTIKADGCVRAHFPRHDLRRGDFDLYLDKGTLERTARQLDAAGVAQYSASALRGRLQKAAESAAGGTQVYVYRTVDENIIEFRFASRTKQLADVAPVRLTTLQNDLLQLPDDPVLIGLAAADEAFREIAARAHEVGARARP